MSILAIQQYYKELEKLIQFGGTKKETAIRNAFYSLLNSYANQRGFMLVPEVSVMGLKGKPVTPDGTLKDAFRQDWGYWESKDEADDIDEEIRKKFSKGYPRDNILFEDSKTVILIQSGQEVMRIDMTKSDELDRILNAFIKFERPEVAHFRDAIEHFKADIPRVTDTIRDMIEEEQTKNDAFAKARNVFLELCRHSINPEITEADVREMMIQHILTEDIFNVIFDETQFHRENNIARELEKVISTFFTGNVKRGVLGRIQHYYQAINTAASSIPDHHEKQKFLKILYETFYKSYNPKAADRLGVVYTPNEIVKFMIESTDYLLQKHFGRFLEDKNVEILDPAAGTGTYICDIIDYMRKDKVEYKYKNEMHANEVAILPYYIANLNIEYTYKQKTGNYEEFQNLCFVDTLDNSDFDHKDKEFNMFTFSHENTERIKKQNNRKISVVIGNPPYSAKQTNYNYQNANKAYGFINKRIKNSYVALGTSQNQNQVYDSYLKFLRWATDRLHENGIVAFITNRGFLDKKEFDGVRKTLEREFDSLYFYDLGGDIVDKKDKTLATGNVFKIKTGVAISFLVKMQKNKDKSALINYYKLSDTLNQNEKLQYIGNSSFATLEFENIRSDKYSNWINQIDNDFETLLPLITKERKGKHDTNAIFSYFSRGLESNREEWVYDFSKETLLRKIEYLIEIYTNQCAAGEAKGLDSRIKWSRELVRHLSKKVPISLNHENIVFSVNRPFIKQFLYIDDYLNSYVYDWKNFKENVSINFISGISKSFSALASNMVPDLNSLSPAAGGAQCLPLFRFDSVGNRVDNVTNWSLKLFVEHYHSKRISKADIFHYVYSVLHNPAYREKYELNLKRDFPRIPFYDDFFKWAAWGKKLMDLHINYETVKPFALKRTDIPLSGGDPAGKYKKDIFGSGYDNNIKAKLKADKTAGTIELDEVTTLSGIPKEAWDYRLGNRSALEWILDQYKEKKPKDPTIAEKFNTYRFADYKEQVIDILMRVTTVSVETMKIIKEMEKEK